MTNSQKWSPVEISWVKSSQVWTPAWVGEAMAEYVLRSKPSEVFDPALGAGNLWQATRNRGFAGLLSGCEIDQHWRANLEMLDGRISWQDFLDYSRRDHQAIIANPPYIRHHALPAAYKLRWQAWVEQEFELRLDARAGLHVYFFLKCLSSLATGGRLSFIVSADIAEGVFSTALWQAVAKRFILDGVFSFAAAASPFPKADVHALVFCLRRPVVEETMPSTVSWFRVETPPKDFAGNVKAWADGGYWPASAAGVQVVQRAWVELLETGLSRKLVVPDRSGRSLARLGEVFRVVRGIATGDNQFFLASKAVWQSRGIADKYLAACVSKVREIQVPILTKTDLQSLPLEKQLFILNAPVDAAEHDDPLRAYLALGVAQGLPGRPLISTRRPWWRMERREPPPLLFAYLGRRAQRFVLNQAGVVPLTSYLCVYPRLPMDSLNLIWWHARLNSEAVVAGLSAVGKSYGGGAIKVEPRALERLLLPTL